MELVMVGVGGTEGGFEVWGYHNFHRQPLTLKLNDFLIYGFHKPAPPAALNIFFSYSAGLKNTHIATKNLRFLSIVLIKKVLATLH